MNYRLLLACVMFAGYASATQFTVKDGTGKVCFIADIDAVSVEVTYPTGMTTAKATVDLTTATPSGVCGDNVTLTRPFGHELTVSFASAGGKAVLNKVVFNYNLSDSTVFSKPNTTDYLKTTIVEPKLSLSADSTFYKCSALKTDFPKGEATLNVKTIKLQAFNLNNGGYAGNGELCAQDLTTAAPTTAAPTTVAPTTVAPTTVAPTVPPTTSSPPKVENKFVVADENGSVCLVLTTTTFNVSVKCDNIVNDYIVNANETITSGTCSGEDSDKLVIADKQKMFTINLIFTLDGNLYHLANASVDSASCHAFSYGKTSDLRAPTANVYRCNAEKKIEVDGNTTLIMAGVKMQAFRTHGNSTDLSDTEYICMEDSVVSNIVPIAVGCALAGLIVIVLIAYIIGRLRRRPYEPV